MKLMAFVMACEILIGNYRFRQASEVTIVKNWRELADTCEILLPRNIDIGDNRTNTLESYIKVGDRVSVKLWYLNYPAREEFTGYVKRLNPNIPFGIECENDVYFLRKTPIKKTWVSTTLKEVVKYVVDEVNKKHNAGIVLSAQLPDVNFKPFVIQAGVTAAGVLQKLQENYGLTSYFKGKELFTGLAYQNTYGRVKYSLAWNVIQNDLTYRNADDVLLKAKAIGIKLNNTKVVVDDVGDTDGEERTLYYFNVTDKAQLRKLAQEELQKMKFTGYEGDITTFLYPYAEPLMIAELNDPQYGDVRAGAYIIDSVKTVFGYGVTRTVELGVKLSLPNE
jgi:hypothetical protein